MAQMNHPYKRILIPLANGMTIQLQDSKGAWNDFEARIVLTDIANGYFAPERYRVKPKTISINGIDVPCPECDPLKENQNYWLADVTKGLPRSCYWLGDNDAHQRLNAGLIHLDELAAKTHIKALLSFTELAS